MLDLTIGASWGGDARVVPASLLGVGLDGRSPLRRCCKVMREKRVAPRSAAGLVVRQRRRTGCARAARFGERDTLSRDAPRSSQPRPRGRERESEARIGKGPRELKLGERALATSSGKGGEP